MKINNICYARFRHLKEGDAEKNTLTELTIDNKGIRLFNRILGDRCSFYEIENKEWLLVFFEGSEFEKKIEVITSDYPIKHNDSDISDAFYVNNNGYDENVLEIAKVLLENKSLKASDFQETSKNSGMISAGNGFLCVTQARSRFERALILNALAHAYKLVIHEVSKNITNEVINNDNKKLLQWAERGFRFNAAFYTKYPIKLENREMVKFWEVFERHWRITEINDELTYQLGSIQGLLQAKEHHDQSIKWGVLITVGGLVITLLSTYIAHVLGWNS